MTPKIKVKNSGVVHVQSIHDRPDGTLTVAQVGEHIPFDIKRIYYITNLAKQRSVRGQHAHKKLEQIIFCINGSFDLLLDDGIKKQKIKMNKPSFGIRLGKRLWHSMKNFSDNCVILVLADDLYKEKDYIRNYKDFLKHINK